jgi:DNA-binding transcriptional LysR family regulator
MKLQHIRHVLAVAKFGSLRAAARHLGMVQPSISRSIQEIEYELGAALFDRLPRGVRLTPIGEAFVKRAAIIDVELRRVRDEVDQLKALSTGNVTIALSLASSIPLMPEMLSPFYQKFPDAKLTILESLLPSVQDDVLQGNIDAYIGSLDPLTVVSPELVVEELFDIQMVVVARKSHPAMRARSNDELNNLKWGWLLSHAGTEEGKISDWARSTGLDHPRTVLQMNSVLQIVLAIASSDFLAIAPREWLQMPGLSDVIGVVPVAPELTSMPVCLVRQRNVPMTPMAEYFCNLMRGLAKTYRASAASRRGVDFIRTAAE